MWRRTHSSPDEGRIVKGVQRENNAVTISVNGTRGWGISHSFNTPTHTSLSLYILKPQAFSKLRTRTNDDGVIVLYNIPETCTFQAKTATIYIRFYTRIFPHLLTESVRMGDNVGLHDRTCSWLFTLFQMSSGICA